MICLTSVCPWTVHIIMQHALHRILLHQMQDSAHYPLPGWQAASQVLSWPVENPHLWALPEELAAHAGLLPGKLLDVPVARPVLWTPTARLMTIALGAATALAVAWLACCTCWFLGFFERVPVKREDDPPVFADTPGKEKPLAVRVVEEDAADREAYIIE